jgi:hypothetical protein
MAAVRGVAVLVLDMSVLVEEPLDAGEGEFGESAAVVFSVEAILELPTRPIRIRLWDAIWVVICSCEVQASRRIPFYNFYPL